MRKVSRTVSVEEKEEHGGFTCAIICMTACHVIPPWVASISSQISAF